MLHIGFEHPYWSVQRSTFAECIDQNYWKLFSILRILCILVHFSCPRSNFFDRSPIPFQIFGFDFPASGTRHWHQIVRSTHAIHVFNEGRFEGGRWPQKLSPVTFCRIFKGVFVEESFQNTESFSGACDREDRKEQQVLLPSAISKNSDEPLDLEQKQP